MRRKTSFLATLALAATTAAMPATAHADATVVSLTTQFDSLSADRVATVTLKAKSPSGITNIAADVSDIANPGGWVPFTTLRFTRVDGTDNDGTWQAEFRSDIENHAGYNRIGVQITTADGATITRATGLTNCYVTSIADFESSPSVIDIDNSAMTLGGRVLRQKHRDAPLEPLSGVTVNGSGGVRTQTGTDGSFRLTSSGFTSAQAYVPMQEPLCPTSRWAPAPTVIKKPMTATAELVAPKPVVTGTQVRIKGHVSRQGLAGPVRVGDVYFQVVRNHGTATAHQVAADRTTADGAIDIAFAADASGPLTVVVADTEWLQGTTAAAGSLEVRHTAKITGFQAGPEPLPYGDPVLASGTLKDGDDEPIAGVPVVLEYSADGKTGWRTMFTATTSGTGQFSMSPRGITRDGYWRTRFAGNATHFPAISWSDYVDVRYRTEIFAFNASPEPAKKGKTITVRGLLHRFIPKESWAPGAAVHIYFKPSGSTTWKQMAVTKTASDGYFKKTFTASKDGTWMAIYKGGATYIKSNAPTDYVDVR
ncbi:hypothetical protein [Spirillospora albida]|uniref:hypothetical protein n=1 Tax=Spirillospora albida TaxID=58123 RepID=UPI0004C18E29|nr:hypothetical protein [Spirillospora albida]